MGTTNDRQITSRKKVKAVTAIILAAGRSSRMGEFKPVLPFGNKTVIEACIGNLRAAGVEEIVVVVGYRADDVRNQLSDAAVKFATNSDPESEMSASIALGIRTIEATATAVLITPVDHPAVPPETIKKLIDAWRDGAKLVQPEFKGKGGHPVLIDLAFRDELLNLNSESGLRGFFSKHREQILRLPVNSPFVAQDMDTWDDYVRLYKAVFGRKPSEK